MSIPVHECPGDLPSVIPVRAWQIWPNGECQLLKALRFQSEIFKMVDIACVNLYSGIEISDSVLGSIQPRRELIRTLVQLIWACLVHRQRGPMPQAVHYSDVVTSTAVNRSKGTKKGVRQNALGVSRTHV